MSPEIAAGLFGMGIVVAVAQLGRMHTRTRVARQEAKFHPAPVVAPHHWEPAEPQQGSGVQHALHADAGLVGVDYFDQRQDGELATFARFDVHLAAPPLEINRRTNVDTGGSIAFESPAFNQEFCVTCPDERFAYAFVSRELIEVLLGAPDLVSLGVRDGVATIRFVERILPDEALGLAVRINAGIPELVRVQYRRDRDDRAR
ncbi:MAG TPA: hypothetical protein VFR41_03670 [Acidimicrobiia bacterium]|nr:hypothetical protein [Acidimicrobiia bacterium]